MLDDSTSYNLKLPGLQSVELKRNIQNGQHSAIVVFRYYLMKYDNDRKLFLKLQRLC